MELDDKVCYCFHVSKRKVLNYIRMHQPRRASQISDCGGAGTGCGWCIPYLKRYFEQAQQQAAASGSPAALEPELTPAEYAPLRAGYIREGKGKPAAGAEPLPTDP